MSEALKPCPFCGGQDIFVDEDDKTFHCGCRKCGARTWYVWKWKIGNKQAKKSAIALWNTRKE